MLVGRRGCHTRPSILLLCCDYTGVCVALRSCAISCSSAPPPISALQDLRDGNGQSTPRMVQFVPHTGFCAVLGSCPLYYSFTPRALSGLQVSEAGREDLTWECVAHLTHRATPDHRIRGLEAVNSFLS